MYAVCRNGKCAQTYHVEDVVKGRSREVFMKDIAITKGFRCEKCKDIVVDIDGTATMSTLPDVRTFIRTEELEKLREREIKEAKEKLKEAEESYNSVLEEYGDV